MITNFRKLHKFLTRLKLKNKNFSLISSNCNGTFILKDLNLKYNTPFINLWLYPKDFLKFVSNIDYYSNLELEFEKNEEFSFPVGILDDIKIFFQHYSNEKEAKEKWERRVKRINKENIFILMTDRDGAKEEDLIAFDNLPFENKIVLTNKKYLNIKSSIYISGFEKENCVGNCYEYKNWFSIKRKYEAFDFVTWFNSSKIR